jgi:hypothetical protein
MTNPIEPTFVTSGTAPRSPRAPGSRAAGLAVAFELIESDQARRRLVNAPHLIAPVRSGATFVNGKLVEQPDGRPSIEA